MQMVVLTGPFTGASVNLDFRGDRLCLDWKRPPKPFEQAGVEHRSEGLRIPLFRRDGAVAAYAWVDAQDAALAWPKWSLHSGGYAVRSEAGRMILMHRLIVDAPPGFEVDHINRDRLDNRRSNLRITTRVGNARNCSRNRRNTQPYKGIRCVGRRWGATLRCDGVSCCISPFDTPEEAAVAYDLMAIALFGDFAAPNFSYREDHRETFQPLLECVAEALQVG